MYIAEKVKEANFYDRKQLHVHGGIANSSPSPSQVTT